jgi:hypothetical protein
VPPRARNSRTSHSRARGQAGVDYVAALLVVVCALGAVGLAAGGAALPGAVHQQILRALCIVRHGECELDRLPCSVSVLRREDAAAARILVFRVGRDRTVMREERSDGTIAVTVADGKQAGLEASAGVELALTLGGWGIAVGGELDAFALATREHGATWLLRDPRAADALVRRLAGSRGGSLPAPRWRYRHGGLAVGGVLARGGAALALSSEDVAGTRVDLATGNRTEYLQRTVDGSLTLTTAAGGGATGSGRARERYAVTYDRDGRPIDLMIMTTDKLRAVGGLPAALRPVAGLVSTRAGRSRWWVQETHLDLTDPESLRLATAFLAQVRHPGTVVFGPPAAIAGALRRRLAEVAVIHARAYDARERRFGIGGTLSLGGLPIGGSVSRTLEDSRLVAATTRGFDGVWRRREDCLARA